MNFQTKNNQHGLSFWGFIWGVVLFISICYLLIISIPPYLNNQKLYRSLEDLAMEPTILTMHRAQMIRLLNRKLNIDYVDTIVNINKAFKIKSIEGKRDLSIDYELVVPVAYNVSLLFDFKNHVLAPLE